MSFFSNVLPSGVNCISSRTAPFKRSAHAGNDGSVAGRRGSGSLIGSIIAKSLAIFCSIVDCPVDPIAPGSIPIFRGSALVGRVVPEFCEFDLAALQTDQRD